jgi:hypothetical protein
MNLHWLPIRSRIEYKLATICYKCKNDDSAPQYLKDLLEKKRQSGYNTRSSIDTTALSAGPIGQKTLGDRSFTCTAPCVWNSLPIAMRQSAEIVVFKRSLKTHLFQSAYT